GASATCSADPFHLTSDATAIVGDPAKMVVTYTSAAGATQTDTITIYLGQKTMVDPQGPDEYGYYCFDNTDINYAQVPSYDWVEIDPEYGGAGTRVPIYDYGEEDDESVMVQLPFTFRYYGEDVNEITVCTNGWIATHADISYTDFRNYRIPSQIGPRGMIAPFWDDLITSPGGVYAYNDVLNHRFIVEWSRMQCGWTTGNPQEIFEVILYDPVYYPTPTGDSEILFQYNYIQEEDGDYSDNPYSTVGIESPDQTIGIEVVNWLTYRDPAAAHLAPGRAYLFTTNIVTSGEPPIIGVNPTALNITAPQTGSGSDILTISNTGELSLAYTLSFDVTDALGGPDQFGYTWIDSDEPGGPAYAWIDVTTSGTEVTFTHNDSTTTNLPIGFNFPFYGELQSEFIISANGWISFSDHSGAWNNLTIPNSSAPRDLIAPFWDDLDPTVGGEVRYYSNNADSLIVSFIQVPHYGSTTVGTYTCQTILTAAGTITLQYDYLDGNYQSCTIGIQNDAGTDGLEVAYNEAYLHTGLAVQFTHPFLQAMPPSGAVPGGQSRDVEIIAYGYGLDEGTYNATLGIDCNDPVTPHVDVPITINIGGSVNPGMVINLTYNSGSPVPSGGGNLYFDVFVSNNSGQALDFDAWLDVEYEGGNPTTVVMRSFTNYQPGWQINRPNMFFPVPGAYAAGDYMFYGRVGDNPTLVWVESGFPFAKSGEYDGSDFQPFIPENVPNPFDRIITGDDYQALPQEFVFHGCYPNPFNPITKVQFDLPSTAVVTVRVFDTMGRLVSTLHDGIISAGSHNLHWNAEKLSSGVYFLTFQKGDFNTTQKLLLIK
ncbi:T9SS type A sorting domain-containing protein, partial [bacterium]|nr:T9SS type A sorting domain-containing protein [bacterium]